MKNQDEFRRTVMEKAERYEKERKARNKKIRESVLLCSICIVISLTVYLGAMLDGIHKCKDAEPNEAETVSDGPSNMENFSTDSEELTASTDGEPSRNTEAFYTTSTDTTDHSAAETTRAPETGSHESDTYVLDFSFAAKMKDMTQISSESSAVIGSVSELTGYLKELHDLYEVPYVTVNRILSAYSEEYFESHSLIAVKMKDSTYRTLTSGNHTDDGKLQLSFQSTGTGNSLGEIQIYHYFITAKKENYSTIEIISES